jgi:hypothetical protein
MESIVVSEISLTCREVLPGVPIRGYEPEVPMNIGDTPKIAMKRPNILRNALFVAYMS